MKKYLLKYSLEFLVIVMGISVSFYLDKIRKDGDKDTLSIIIYQNLLNEINEIEKYAESREFLFTKDLESLIALINPKISGDSLITLRKVKKFQLVSFLNYRGFSPPNSVYNSIVGDGNLTYIQSIDLKKELNKMHNTHFNSIDSNVDNELEARKKIIEHIQINYPKIYLNGQFKYERGSEFYYKLKTIVDGDLTLQAYLYEKQIAMQIKNIGLNNYKESISKIKNLLMMELSK